MIEVELNSEEWSHEEQYKRFSVNYLDFKMLTEITSLDWWNQAYVYKVKEFKPIKIINKKYSRLVAGNISLLEVSCSASFVKWSNSYVFFLKKTCKSVSKKKKNQMPIIHYHFFKPFGTKSPFDNMEG